VRKYCCINTLWHGRLLQELAGSIPLKAIRRLAFSWNRRGLIFQLTGVLFSKLVLKERLHSN